MYLLRRIVLLLWVISLPGYGWALTAMPACAVQHTATSSSAVSDSAHSGHCCPTQSTKHSSDTSTPTCQDGSHCQCSALYQTPQAFTASTTPSGDTLIESKPFQPITTAALPLWRPPTFN